MITQETGVFLSWLNAQKQMTSVIQYREQLANTKQEVLDKALKQLKNGKSAEEALHFLAHTLTNKLGHMPTQTMNHAAHSGDLEILKSAKRLLGLSNIAKQTSKKED
jgi:glutamyl-tRNA reductase